MPSATTVPVAGRLSKDDAAELHRRAKARGTTVSLVLKDLVRASLSQPSLFSSESNP